MPPQHRCPHLLGSGLQSATCKLEPFSFLIVPFSKPLRICFFNSSLSSGLLLFVSCLVFCAFLPSVLMLPFVLVCDSKPILFETLHVNGQQTREAMACIAQGRMEGDCLMPLPMPHVACHQFTSPRPPLHWLPGKSENSRRLWLCKTPAGRVFQAYVDAAGESSPMCRQHKVLSLPGFGSFLVRKTAA